MASPHAAGAAAVLLAAQPTLTTAEVRWHLELNADQPGYPGYEGEATQPDLWLWHTRCGADVRYAADHHAAGAPVDRELAQFPGNHAGAWPAGDFSLHDDRSEPSREASGSR